jgi:hypothetical protein
MLRLIMRHTNRISKIRYDNQDTYEISVYSGKTCNQYFFSQFECQIKNTVYKCYRRAVDPHCFDADPDPDPAQNLDADPDPDPDSDPGGGG